MDVGTFMQTIDETLSDFKYEGMKIDNNIVVYKILIELSLKFDIFV